MTKTYEYHELAGFFPMLPEKEFEALKDSISEIGQREPITLYEGKILDGRNRYEACQELGVEPKVTELNGDIDPLEYVTAANIRRRHLSAGEKIGILRRIYPPAEQGSNQHEKKTGPDRASAPRTRAQTEIAQKAGVSERTVRRFDRSVRDNPDLAEKMASGELSPSQAEAEAKRREARGTWRYGKDIPPMIDGVQSLGRWANTVENRILGPGNKLHHEAAQFLGHKLDEIIEQLTELRETLREMENGNA